MAVNVLFVKGNSKRESKKSLFLTFKSLRHVHNISLATFCFGLLKIKTRQTKVFSYYLTNHLGTTTLTCLCYLLRPLA